MERRPIDARQTWVKVPPTNKKPDMAVPYQELEALANSTNSSLQAIADRLTKLEASVQAIADRLTKVETQLASQQTPTPTPTPTPTETVLYNFDYAALNSNKFASSGTQIAFGITDGTATVVRNGGGYSGLTATMAAGVNLSAGTYRLICNCRVDSGSAHQIYAGSGSARTTKTITNTAYADVSTDFTLTASVTNFSAFGQENHAGGSTACFMKNFRIIKL